MHRRSPQAAQQACPRPSWPWLGAIVLLFAAAGVLGATRLDGLAALPPPAWEAASADAEAGDRGPRLALTDRRAEAKTRDGRRASFEPSLAPAGKHLLPPGVPDSRILRVPGSPAWYAAAPPAAAGPRLSYRSQAPPSAAA